MPITTVQSMAIEAEIKNMKVGSTKIINGISVTRWSEAKYEVGTLGRSTMTFWPTFDLVVNQ